MRDRHVLDELSAYLDGEAKEPESIARHLQQCADCARRYMDLSKVSAHLQGLPAPDVHPAFAQRVMAHARETRPVRRRRWAPVSAVACAALLLVLAGTAWFLHDGEPTADLDLAGIDPDVLVEEIARRDGEGLFAETGWDVLWEMGSAMGWDSEASFEEDTESGEEWMDVLASQQWLDPLAVSFDSESDVYALVDDLDAAETEALKELLIEYAQEGMAS